MLVMQAATQHQGSVKLTLSAGRGIGLEMRSASPVRWSTCAYIAGHWRQEKLYLICCRKQSIKNISITHTILYGDHKSDLMTINTTLYAIFRFIILLLIFCPS